MTQRHEAPPGFVAFAADGAEVVCAEHLEAAVRTALASETLFRYAEHHPQAQPLAGRGVAYAVPLPGDVEHVVVRHNRHGGALAGLTGDLFVGATRAPHELAMCERLRAARVRTPAVLAYAVYPVGGLFRRVDVMTRLVPWSVDLSVSLMSEDSQVRHMALTATAELLHDLAAAGARHHDLNVKNVLLRGLPNDGVEALALDVDRVSFPANGRVHDANLARLLRSARKWQSERGAKVTTAELDEFSALVGQRGRSAPRSTRS